MLHTTLQAEATSAQAEEGWGAVDWATPTAHDCIRDPLLLVLQVMKASGCMTSAHPVSRALSRLIEQL